MGKQISELIGNDVRVMSDGSVTGTLKHVTDFEDFSSDTSLQSGYYFPFTIEKTGTTMTLKKNGTAIPDRTGIPFDAEMILRIENASTTFTIEVDSVEVITLSFAGATFAS